MEERVDSWTELHERLFDEPWRPELGRFRSNYAFRGRADATEDLRSSLIRLGGDTRNVEGYLLRNRPMESLVLMGAIHGTWDWPSRSGAPWGHPRPPPTDDPSREKRACPAAFAPRPR